MLKENLIRIGLIMVFNTILKGRQSGEKLQCLYGNPIDDKYLFPKLNFSQFVNQNVKILSRRIVFTKFKGHSFARSH